MKEFIVTEKDASQRIDKYVKKVLNEAPLSFIYRLFRVKDIKVNNKKTDISYVLKTGDVIKIYVTDSQLDEFSKKKIIIPTKVDLDIIYEDKNILVINKPRGILVHGDENESRATLSNQVINYLYEKNEYNPNDHLGFVPSPAHRLDRNTSGLVLFGKNINALQSLFEIIKNKENVAKYYLALLDGNLTTNGRINKPLRKDENTGIVKVCSLSNGGKSALTLYKIEESFKDKTLVSAKLITGRTHQLRVHFSSIGYPIIGDSKYGNFVSNKEFEKKYKFHDQFLHAYKIIFGEIKGELSYLSNKEFVATLPAIEESILKDLRKDK